MPKRKPKSTVTFFDLSGHPRCNERLRQFLSCLRDLLENDPDDPTPNKIRKHQLAQKFSTLRPWQIDYALILAFGRRKGRPRGRKIYS
jgi:hypothetical protein